MVPRIPTRFKEARGISVTPWPTQRRVFSAGAHDAPPHKNRAVVGSFLFRRHDDGTPRVALFRRSDKVNTYQRKYATISGGIEPEDASPFKAALRELHEETRLTPESLNYLCPGKPYSFIDNRVHYEWSVYPFAFHWPADAKEPLVLGWEHDGHAWFRPHEILESDVAAGVIESLRRVWPEGSLGQVDVLCRYCLGEAVGEETKSDARLDASEAFRIFSSTVKGLTTSNTDEWRRQVRLAAWHVWNHSEQSVKAPLLTQLLPGLELLEQLLEPQHQELAPQFEKLAAMALENVRVQHMDDQGVTSESNLTYLTHEADRFFSGLWEV